MASSFVPPSTTDGGGQHDGTTWRRNSPPPSAAESEHLLNHDGDNITAVTSRNVVSNNNNLNLPFQPTEEEEEKKQTTTASIAAVDAEDNTGHDQFPCKRCAKCSHRPHRKPWTVIADFLREPYRSFYKEEREVPKPAINRPSLSGLFAHLWIHVIPVFATGALIGMNLWNPRNGIFEGWYIGAELWGPWGSEATLNFLQLAAKMHETIIQASLTAVAVDLVRYFLVYRPLGVPLGLIGAGASFVDMKYLLSKELHGIWKTKYNTFAKITVFIAVIFFCAMANLVGPSSAILLIPRNHTWTVAEFAFHLNGTREDHLWPTTLTIDHAGGPDCHADATEPYKDDNCVSGAYGGIARYLKSFIAYSNDWKMAFDILDSRTSRTLTASTRHSYTNHYSETWTMAPHAATVVVAEPVRVAWNMNLWAVNHNFRFATERSIVMDSTSPVVRAACEPVPNLTDLIFNDTDTGEELFPMSFPILQEETNWVPAPPRDPKTGQKIFGGGPTASINLTSSLLDLSSEDLNTTTKSNQRLIIRTHWIELPPSIFPFVQSGLLILISASDNSKERPHDYPRFKNAFGCVADARWTKAENAVSSSLTNWATYQYGYQTKTTPKEQRDPPDDHNGHGDRMFLPSRSKGWEPITLTKSWLDALTPMINVRAGLPTSTLGALLEDWIPTPWAVAEHEFFKDTINGYITPHRHELVAGVEHVIANLVVDGVARVGLSMQGMIWDLARPLSDQFWGSETKGIPPNRDFSLGVEPLVAPFNGSSVVGSDGEVDVGMGDKMNERLVMTAMVEGYGLRMAGRGGLFGLVVMVAYLVVVVLHVVFVVLVMGCRTSDAFSSPVEMLLLGMAGRSNNRKRGDEKVKNDMDMDIEMEEMLSCGGLGIERAATYAKKVRIGTMVGSDRGNLGSTTATPAMEKVVLSLEGGSDDQRGDLGNVKPGVVYGLRYRR